MGYSVIIPAAGIGSRMNSDKKKQFIELAGKPILSHTISRFEECDKIEEIIVVTNKNEIEFCSEYILKEHSALKKMKVVEGGGTRQESVYKGLQQIGSSVKYVVIHDGVRPFIEKIYLDNLLKKVTSYKGCVLGVPVKDTIKRVSTDLTVVETPKRAELWAIQTPQAFDKDILIKAHEEARKSHYIGTDDASLVEAFTQVDIKVIEGSYNNIKITTPEDLIFGERLLKSGKNML